MSDKPNSKPNGKPNGKPNDKHKDTIEKHESKRTFTLTNHFIHDGPLIDIHSPKKKKERRVHFSLPFP